MANDAQAEHDGSGWRIRFGDPLVTQLRVDYAFTLILGGGALVVLENAFDLNRNGVHVRVPAGEAVFEVAEALPLFNMRLETAYLRASGELHLELSAGVTATVPVDPHYESWEIVMPDGEQWIGTPGGGVHHIAGS